MSSTHRKPSACWNRVLCSWVVLASCLMAGNALAQPANVLVTLPAGAEAPSDLAATLAAWRQSGEVSDVLWLDAAQKEKAGFTTLILLEFATQGSYDVWAREEAPKLRAPLVVRRADVLTHGEITPRDSNRSIFRVEIVEPAGSAADYQKFVEGYVAPDWQEQRARRILIRYSAYLERATSGRRAQAVLVTEYRDAVAFERRHPVQEAFQAKRLASDPAWKAFHEARAAASKTVSGTLASYTELPPPQLPGLPPYTPEFKVVGSLRIIGSELKNAVEQLAAGFQMFHPESKPSISRAPSSEGGIAGLYMFTSDVAPMGDDAKITDMMPFYNTFGYMPTEISVATGGYEKRGSLWAWAIVVNKDNPLDHISVEELKRVFGAERSGGWEMAENDYRFTSKYARTKDTNIRTWDQLGLTGEYAGREIETFGYAAPGFATAIERSWFHWSKKWNPNFMEYVEAKQTTPDEAGAKVASTVPLAQLATNRFAMGIAGLMHVKNYPHIKVLKISREPGGPAFALTPENVATRVYPLVRDAYFYVNKPPGQKLDPKVREFMRFVLSREGQEIIARVGYYYPLDAAYLKEQLKKLD